MLSFAVTTFMAIFFGMSWWWPAAFALIFFVASQVLYNKNLQKK